MRAALLIDITLCIGCNSCQDACKRQNQLPGDTETRLSATAYTALEKHDGVTVRRMCQHCLEPACASACPVGALRKTAEGPVIYEEGRCIGCRYCMQACPFQVPRYEWRSTHPRVRKCRLCYDRIRDGLQTACAEACPTGATKFGHRDDLLLEAARRIQSDPARYARRIYGRTEVGGTSVLYLAGIPFEQLGFKTLLSNEPLPAISLKAISAIPDVVMVGGALLAGVYWIVNRRVEVERAGTRGCGAEERNHHRGPHNPWR